MEITIELNEKETENYKLFKEGKIALKKISYEDNYYYIFMYKNMLVVIVDEPYIITDQKEINKIVIEFILENSIINFNCKEVVELVKNKIYDDDNSINIYYYIDDDNIIGYNFEKEKLIHFLSSLFYNRKKINKFINYLK